jgi:hypothetical protein
MLDVPLQTPINNVGFPVVGFVGELLVPFAAILQATRIFFQSVPMVMVLAKLELAI